VAETIDINGRQVRYELTGEGDTVIAWTHGIGSNLETWRPHMGDFPGYRHLTYDVRGMGESGGVPGPVSLSVWAQDLSDLMAALGIERAIIAGHSMGGAISQRFAIDFPEKTLALLLLSTSSRVGALATANWMRQADETEKTNPFLAAAQRAVAEYNMDEGLKRVGVPTLILVGDKDPTTPAGGSVIMSRLVPHSELEIYPGIGHSIFKESPDAIARSKSWLETLSV
jgi:pimeloyl-ACP methyl ester carboxylesterase